jgi:hypothetical protein
VNRLFVFYSILIFSSGLLFANPGPEKWPQIETQHKPWTYWWWLGSAVDKENLNQNLELYHDAGIGGVHIIPIYGVKGYEDRYIEYLSPRWSEMLDHTTAQASRLGMGVDMTTGTGWPFGGPQIDATDAVRQVQIETFTLQAGQTLESPIRLSNAQAAEYRGKHPPLIALEAFSEHGEIKDLMTNVDEDGILSWQPHDGEWTLYAVFNGWSGMQVKRAAPGGEGNVMDYFSYESLQSYLKPFDDFFDGYRGKPVRAFYNDSYEVKSDWTRNFFNHFQQRRGYDLRDHLPSLAGEGKPDKIARIKSDYRETVSDLLIDVFTKNWVKWCHDRNSMTRNQAHGMPANFMDSYACTDIPETENTRFGHKKHMDVLGSKFASAAAHLTGKTLIASESCTWLGEHFNVSLAEVKTEVDKLFLSGVNHIFYHGIPYSPVNEQWPGWLFYASTHFGPTNTFWPDFDALNHYIARCQSFLQMGNPDNRVLLYFPIHDVWHNPEGMLIQFTQRLDWFNNTPFRLVAETLQAQGIAFDFVSDRLLQQFKVNQGILQNGKSQYQIVVIPPCRFMPLTTMKKLNELAQQGIPVVFSNHLPVDVPGYADLNSRRRVYQKMLASLGVPVDQEGGQILSFPNRKLWVAEDLPSIMSRLGVRREKMADAGLKFERRQLDDGYLYFVTNHSNESFDEWCPFGVPSSSAMFFDPQTGKSGAARHKKDSQVYLQLEPGESILVRLFDDADATPPAWTYLRKSGRSFDLSDGWNLEYLHGGPVLPANTRVDRLGSWTELGEEYANFSGTALYEIKFTHPGWETDEWLLDLGDVANSAEIICNEQSVGTLFAPPYHIRLGDYLQPGQNKLQIKVSNLMANRIAYMDRQGIEWKKFHNINFVDQHYQPFDASEWKPRDSGLLGPVRLIPCTKLQQP